MSKNEEELIAEACSGGKIRIDREHKNMIAHRKSNKSKSYTVPEWTLFDGINVFRIKDSRFVAVPNSGRKNSRDWCIINLDDRSDVYAYLKKSEVEKWLISAYK